MTSPVAKDVKVFVPTQDLNESVEFYQALGWQLNWKVDGLAEVQLANDRLYLQGFYAKEWAENFMIYVDVDDADAWYQHARKVMDEGRFSSMRVQPPKAQPYGAIVTFVHDPCGVLIHFAQQQLNDS